MNKSSAYVPWELPDANWQRACRIVDRAGYATVRRDGLLVQRVVRCVRQLNQALTERGVRRAAIDYPDVYWALHLQQEASTRVLELKARTLAGQSDRAIANRLGLPRRTVSAFIAMFFDVRPRLRATSWIRWEAIRLPLDQAPSAESLLLLHAWRRGPEVIEPWLDYLKHQLERHDLSTDLGRQRAWIEQLIRVHHLPFEAHCLRSLWKLSYFILRKPPESVRSTTVRTTVLQNRARILAEIPWLEPENVRVHGARDLVRAEQLIGTTEEGGFARAG